MRRSQILQGRKRSAFVSPFLNKNATNSAETETEDRPCKVTKIESVDQTKSSLPASVSITYPPSSSAQVRGTNDILNLLNLEKEVEQVEEELGTAKENEGREPKAAAESLGNERYYSVMWCKLSTKKHKKWEGDAILVVKTRSVTLKDTDGKVIGSGMGYKLKDLEELEDGSTLKVGGKECQIQGSVTTADYLSGRCFQGAPVLAEQTSNAAPPANKKFRNPLLDQSKVTKENGPLTTSPRYPVSSPGAFVLPRPNARHQWARNKKGFPIIDVVVDPQLAVHLREHQKRGVIFLYECVMGMREYGGEGAILADDMGLGKTLQCIVLIWTLLKQGPYGGYPMANRVLVITPSSLVKNWEREFKKWLPSEKLRPLAVEGAGHVKDYVSSRFYPVLIISYEMFVRSCQELGRIAFDLVICDEGHRLKNSAIKASAAISQLSTSKRIVLSGTPVQNDLREFYSIIDFCNPGILGSSSRFQQIYEKPILESQKANASGALKQIGEERAAELSRLTSLFVLRRTKDVINEFLPTKVDYVVFCKASHLQLNLYRKILSSKALGSCLAAFREAAAGADGRNGARHLALITALKKLCNHPYLLYEKPPSGTHYHTKDDEDDDEDDGSIFDEIQSLFPDKYDLSRSEDDSGKLGVVASMLKRLSERNFQEKMVIAAHSTRALDVLEELCRSRGYRFSRLDGTTPTAKRQSLVDSFNEGKGDSSSSVFLLSAKAGGVGLNLIGANRMVLYDIDWNPATDLQTLGRVWRDGQRKRVYRYRLLTSGTLEEKMYQRQVKKQSLSATVLDDKNYGGKEVRFSLEMLRDLFTLKEDSASETHDSMRCPCQTPSVPRDELPPEEVEEDRRQCQLGKGIKSVSRLSGPSKERGMEELSRWDHISQPISASVRDECLLAASEKINFVFRDETKNQ